MILCVSYPEIYFNYPQILYLCRENKSDKGYHGKKYLITIPMYDDRRCNSSSYLRNVFKYIHDRGFKGVLGMEHGNSMPDKAGEQAVINAYLATSNFD